MTEKVLAKIGHYVPGSVVDQTQYIAAFVRILADSNVEISHICVKWRAHITIIKIDPCIVQLGLRGFASRINVAVLPQVILCLGDLAIRARDRSLVGFHATPRVEDVIGRNKVSREQGLNAVEILLVIRQLGVELQLTRFRGPNSIFKRFDLELSQGKIRLGSVYGRLVEPRIYYE